MADGIAPEVAPRVTCPDGPRNTTATRPTRRPRRRLAALRARPVHSARWSRGSPVVSRDRASGAAIQLDQVAKSFGALDGGRPRRRCRSSRVRSSACSGPSGCGKSTLLRLVAGLEPANARRGDRSTADRRHVARRASGWRWCRNSPACCHGETSRPTLACCWTSTRGRHPPTTPTRASCCARSASASSSTPFRTAVGRHAAARRAGARLRARRAAGGDGRAVRRARRDHARRDARPAGAAAAAAPGDGAVRDPLDHRGGAPVAIGCWCARRGRHRSSPTSRSTLARPRRADLEDDPAFVALCAEVRHRLHEAMGR